MDFQLREMQDLFRDFLNSSAELSEDDNCKKILELSAAFLEERPQSPWPKDLEDITSLKSFLDSASLGIIARVKMLAAPEFDNYAVKVSPIRQLSAWYGAAYNLYRYGLILTQQESINMIKAYSSDIDKSSNRKSLEVAQSNAFKRLAPYMQVNRELNGIAQEMYKFFAKEASNEERGRLATELNMQMNAILIRSSEGVEFRVIDPEILAKEIRLFGAIRTKLLAGNSVGADNRSVDDVVKAFAAIGDLEEDSAEDKKAA